MCTQRTTGDSTGDLAGETSASTQAVPSIGRGHSDGGWGAGTSSSTTPGTARVSTHRCRRQLQHLQVLVDAIVPVMRHQLEEEPRNAHQERGADEYRKRGVQRPLQVVALGLSFTGGTHAAA